MTGISARDLAGMRDTAAAFLPESVIIQRGVSTDDNSGGSTDTWTTTSTVPGRLISTAGAETLTGLKVSSDTDWALKVSATADVKVTDRVLVAGSTYSVTRVASPRSWEVQKVLELKVVA